MKMLKFSGWKAWSMASCCLMMLLWWMPLLFMGCSDPQSCDYDGDGLCPSEGDCNDYDATTTGDCTPSPGVETPLDSPAPSETPLDSPAPSETPGAEPSPSETPGDVSTPTVTPEPPTPQPDLDGDGVSVAGGDCNDADAAVYPAAAEVCDSKDNNCNGIPDEGLTYALYYRDADGDGFGSTEALYACGLTPGFAAQSGDCNDADAAVSPAAAEVCDSKDNNCDGASDEGVTQTFYRDEDGDGYGAAENTTAACTVPPGYVSNAADCDDTRADVHPDGTELCNQRDDDCDTQVDESGGFQWYLDQDNDGYGQDSVTTQACEKPSGYASQAGDCNDQSPGTYPGAQEQCNSVDDDCDTLVDEGVVTSTWYLDQDGDNYGQSSSTQQSCARPANYTDKSGDCDDTKASVYPGAKETCNNIDDNCSGTVDEGVTTTYYLDSDGDGYGSTTSTQACSMPTGYVTNAQDCNDKNAAIKPGVSELAGDSVDQNCDGKETCYKDADNDGYRPDSTSTVASSDTDCADAYEATSSDATGDCNDASASVNPKATELEGDSIDQNCDGKETCYVNADGDRYRLTSTLTSADTDCNDAGEAPASAPSPDCNDTKNYIYPGAPEVCGNGSDDDCDDSTADEAGQVGIGNNSYGTSIQNAVNALTTTGTINVCSGTYAAFSIEGKTGITLLAKNGANTVVVKGGSCSGIRIKSSSSITLNGIKVNSNKSNTSSTCDSGGGILVGQSNPIYIQSLEISSNYASAMGGGLYVTDSTVYVTSVAFKGNTCGDKGAGVYARGTSYVRLESSTLDGHPDNAGLYVRDTDADPVVYVKNTSFCNNEENDIKFDSGPAYDWDVTCSTLRTFTCTEGVCK
ncbi:MAG: MopE-related protein [Myxococcota bacterium]